MKRYKSILVSAALIAFISPLVKGQQLSAIPVETVLQAHRFIPWEPYSISYDGKMLALTVQDPKRTGPIISDVWAKTGVPYASGSDIWTMKIETGETRNLTEGKGINWEPKWSPDGRLLAFFSNRDGSEQAKLWLWEARTGSLKRVSDLAVRSSRIEWLPDSRRVLVTVVPESMSPEQWVDRVTRSSTERVEETKAPGATVTIYRASAGVKNDNPQVSLDRTLRDLVAVDTQSGTLQWIDHGHRIGMVWVSPDGSSVAITRVQPPEKAGSTQRLFDLVTIDLASLKERVLVRAKQIGFYGLAVSWSPDGKYLGFWISAPKEVEDGDYYVVEASGTSAPFDVAKIPKPISYHSTAAPFWDSESKHIYFLYKHALWQASTVDGGCSEVSKVGGHIPVELIAQAGNRLWSPDGAKSATVMTKEAGSLKIGFYRIDLSSKEVTKLLEEGRDYTSYPQDPHVTVWHNGNQVAYFVSDSQHPPNIWASDAGFRNPRQLTHINPELEKYRMGTARSIEWLSLDGQRLHGALLLPARYEAGKRYPLIVNVYGGLYLSDTLNSFSGNAETPINLQLLATRGYAVLSPDAPQHLGVPMADLAKTILPGVDKAIEMGIADPDRLGVMGHSYGGYTTLSLLVQTKRFKAAVMSAGFGNLISMYGEMHTEGSTYGVAWLEEGQGLMGGSPWQYRERYIENSPSFFLDRVETPLLITQGSADDAVAPFLADEVFVGLRRLGKEVEYAKYAGEDHVPATWSYANYLDFCNRLIAWFDKFLMKPEDIKPANQPASY